MAKSQTFKNDGQRFEIRLEDDGRLHFKANDAGLTRMVIDDDTGTVTIGGSGEFGQLQLTDDNDANTIFLGGEGTEAIATLGGPTSEQHGRIKLFNSSGRESVGLEGSLGRLTLSNPSGNTKVDLKVEVDTIGSLRLLNGSGKVTAELRGDGILKLGRDIDAGNISITCDGNSGDITCVSLNGVPAALIQETDRHLTTDR